MYGIDRLYPLAAARRMDGERLLWGDAIAFWCVTSAVGWALIIQFATTFLAV